MKNTRPTVFHGDQSEGPETTPGGGHLTLAPITLRAAREYVEKHHRHVPHASGHKFSVAATRNGEVVGVAICGRPVSRALDDGETIEVSRLCTTGERNACSFLYAAARRAAKALGHRKVITYTRTDEPGTSLIASGWQRAAETPAQSWNRPNRKRRDKTEVIARVRWEIST